MLSEYKDKSRSSPAVYFIPLPVHPPRQSKFGRGDWRSDLCRGPVLLCPTNGKKNEMRLSVAKRGFPDIVDGRRMCEWGRWRTKDRRARLLAYLVWVDPLCSRCAAVLDVAALRDRPRGD